MIAFFLLFIAPIFQIVFSILKINGRVRLPSGVIALITFFIGIGLSIASTLVVEANIPVNPSGITCGTLAAAFLFAGFFITAIATPVIGLFFFLVGRLSNRNKSPNV